MLTDLSNMQLCDKPTVKCLAKSECREKRKQSFFLAPTGGQGVTMCFHLSVCRQTVGQQSVSQAGSQASYFRSLKNFLLFLKPPLIKEFYANHFLTIRNIPARSNLHSHLKNIHLRFEKYSAHTDIVAPLNTSDATKL